VSGTCTAGRLYRGPTVHPSAKIRTQITTQLAANRARISTLNLLLNRAGNRFTSQLLP
jgi:hypothetical protein